MSFHLIYLSIKFYFLLIFCKHLNFPSLTAREDAMFRGYTVVDPPTIITTHKNARAMIRKVDRDDLLQAMLRSYLNV